MGRKRKIEKIRKGKKKKMTEKERKRLGKRESEGKPPNSHFWLHH